MERLMKVKIDLNPEILDDIAGYLLTTSAGAKGDEDGLGESECKAAWHILRHESNEEFHVRVAGIIFALAEKMVDQRQNPLVNKKLASKNIFALGFKMADAERTLVTQDGDRTNHHFDMEYPR